MRRAPALIEFEIPFPHRKSRVTDIRSLRKCHEIPEWDVSRECAEDGLELFEMVLVVLIRRAEVNGTWPDLWG
jgi:hypothetical protein